MLILFFLSTWMCFGSITFPFKALLLPCHLFQNSLPSPLVPKANNLPFCPKKAILEDLGPNYAIAAERERKKMLSGLPSAFNYAPVIACTCVCVHEEIWQKVIHTIRIIAKWS